MTSERQRTCYFTIVPALVASVLCLGQPQKSAEENGQPDEQVYDLGPGVTPPRVIKQVNPQYPASLRGVRVTGSVTIALIVTSQGMSKDPHVIQGINDEVDRAAIEALKQWRFAPAKKNDKAVAVRVVIEIALHSM